jgi:hypothetical protein
VPTPLTIGILPWHSFVFTPKTTFSTPLSQQVLRPIIFGRDLGEAVLHVAAVDDVFFAAAVAGGEGEFFADFFDDGVEAAGADVLLFAVDVEGELGDGFDGVLGEFDGDLFGGEEGDGLLHEGVFGFGEDAHEVVLGEVAEFDADGEAALEFGHEVAGFGVVKGAGGDEEDVVGAHGAVLGNRIRPRYTESG